MLLMDRPTEQIPRPRTEEMPRVPRHSKPVLKERSFWITFWLGSPLVVALAMLLPWAADAPTTGHPAPAKDAPRKTFSEPLKPGKTRPDKPRPSKTKRPGRPTPTATVPVVPDPTPTEAEEPQPTIIVTTPGVTPTDLPTETWDDVPPEPTPTAVTSTPDAPPSRSTSPVAVPSGVGDGVVLP